MNARQVCKAKIVCSVRVREPQSKNRERSYVRYMPPRSILPKGHAPGIASHSAAALGAECAAVGLSLVYGCFVLNVNVICGAAVGCSVVIFAVLRVASDTFDASA